MAKGYHLKISKPKLITNDWVTLLWNVFLVAGTAYLVAGHGWSGWWFLLTLLLIQPFHPEEEEEST